MDTVRILMIDDDVGFCESMKLFLADTGFTVVTATNGLTGLKLLDGEQFDIVICDLQMPIVGGLEICSKVRRHAKTAAIPFMFLTFSGSETERQAAFDAGADDYIVKPCDPDLLIDRIISLTERKGTGVNSSIRP